MDQYLWLVPLGFVVGTYGTLVGAGGGFVLMPVLLLLYPDQNPELITSISLAVVFFNASSGSWAYARMKRIDYKSGILFGLAAIPGSVLGALSTSYVPRRIFDAMFGLLMISASIILFRNPDKDEISKKNKDTYLMVRNIVDKNNTVHNFSYNPFIGFVLSFFVGYTSGLLGIGGGIIHVPLLVRLLNFPVHIATATSHFILAIMALSATIVHIVSGSFSNGVHRTIALAIGVFLGAQVGAFLSNKIKENWIIRGLAIALGFVGIRIIFLAL